MEQLTRFRIALVQALSEVGITGSQLNDIFSRHLWAVCVRCGIKVTNDEMEQLAIAEDEAQLSDPKLQRLRLGFCARESCDCVCYSFHLQDYGGVDWEIVTKRADSLVSAAKTAEKEDEKKRRTRKRKAQLLRLVAGLSIFTVIFLIIFYVQHRRLPFVKRPQKYQIDPASTPLNHLR